MDHNKCVFGCQLFADEAPVCIGGLCVNCFVCHSNSDKVKQWFKNKLESHVRVNLIGDFNWSPGQRCDWSTDDEGGKSCHVPQQALIEGVLRRFNVQHIDPDINPC